MKTKLIKILGVLATVATLMSLIGVAPVAAADDAWSEVGTTPSSTNLVMPNNLTSTGPMAQAADGSAIWVAASWGGSNYIIKTTDGGRSWKTADRVTLTGALGPAVALAASPTEANVLYYATATTVYKSIDGGKTFVAEANVDPTTMGNINTMAVVQLSGRYIVIIGTAATDLGNVYYLDESLPFYNFVQVGTNSFSQAVVAAGAATAVDAVLAVAVSPNFGTDRAVVAIGTDGVNTYVMVDIFGGAWSATIGTADIDPGTAGLQPIVGVATSAAVAFPSDFNVSTNPFFFFGIGGSGTAASNGVYRFFGAPAPSFSLVNNLTNTPFPNRSIVSLDVSGPSATASIIAGTATASVLRSTTAGASWAERVFNTGATFRVYAAFKKGVAGAAFALVGGPGLLSYDDSGFWITSNIAATTPVWHTISLINNAQTITTLGVTPVANEIFLLGRINATPGTGDTFTLTATAAGTVTVAVAGGATVTVTITTDADADSTIAAGPPIVITFGDAGDVATVVATAAGNVTWTNSTGTATAAETVDTNNSMTVGASGVAFAVDLNAFTQNDFLWRYFGGNWERVNKLTYNSADLISISPAYATDMAIFVGDAGATTAIPVSTNNGDSFANMTGAPGSTVGGADALRSMLALSATSLVVGSDAGVIVRTTNNGFIWDEDTVTNLGTVMDLELAANGDVVAGGLGSGTGPRVAVAKAADLGTWSNASSAVNAALVAATVFVAPAADYGTSGVIYVSSTAAPATGGIYWGTNSTTATWTAADAGSAWRITPGTSGLVAAPSGAGFANEGAGMVYATDIDGLTRVKGRVATTVTSAAELIPEPVISGSSTNISGLFSNAALNSAGKTVLYTIAGGNKVYTYTDTLGKPITGVAVSNIQTSTECTTCPITGTASATVKWDAVTNANYYVVIIDSAQWTNFYAAVEDLARIPDGLAASQTSMGGAVTSATSVTFTGLPADATTYASVWAVKYIGTGALTGSTQARALALTGVTAYGAPPTFSNLPKAISTFGMGAAIITPPAAPLGLAPAPAAMGQPTTPVFQWNAVTGATSYKLQVADNANFTSPIVDVTVTGTSYAYTGTGIKAGTAYFWRVATVTTSGTSAWTTNTFTTAAAPVSQPIIITAPTQPAPTITVPIPTITVPPITLPPISINLPTPTITLPPGTTTTVTPVIQMPEAQTPVYIWIIVAVGALLTIAVIVLIIRTRRVV